MVSVVVFMARIINVQKTLDKGFVRPQTIGTDNNVGLLAELKERRCDEAVKLLQANDRAIH